MLNVPEPPEHVDIQCFGSFNHIFQHTVYSDGSGGEHSSGPVLRRCAFSWITRDSSLALEYGQLKDANEASEDVLEDYQDRMLDLSFQIDDEYRKLTLCNGGKTTNYINSSYD